MKLEWEQDPKGATEWAAQGQGRDYHIVMRMSGYTVTKYTAQGILLRQEKAMTFVGAKARAQAWEDRYSG